MRSFKFILVRNFIILIFLILTIVFLLFNVLTNNFISAEAERELAQSVTRLENIATPTMITSPRLRVGNPSLGIFEEIMMQWRQAGSLQQLMMHTDGIFFTVNNEIIPPNMELENGGITPEIAYLARFFLNNPTLFTHDDAVRHGGAPGTYYLRTVPFYLPDGQVLTVLLFTNITTAVQFMQNINRTLGLLLLLSAVVSLVISVFMSSRVQRAVLRLGNYAETVGKGKFGQTVGNFDIREFTDLARNMHHMSQKLHTYENNQKQFFQNVSHELRTPLMSIQGYAEGIRENIMDKKDATQVILNESARMEDLVTQLLLISRMDSGLDTLRFAAVSLRETLLECIDRVKILAEKNGKEILFDFPPVDILINSDEEKLQRAVGNLLTNAIRHARFSVNITCASTPNAVTIVVEDDGPGIVPADLPHLFNRFYKGTNGNSGLGLAICKDIVEKFGGTITAENTGAGARFTVILAY